MQLLSRTNFLPEEEQAQVYGRLARTDEPVRHSISKSPRVFDVRGELIVFNMCGTKSL